MSELKIQKIKSEIKVWCKNVAKESFFPLRFMSRQLDFSMCFQSYKIKVRSENKKEIKQKNLTFK